MGDTKCDEYLFYLYILDNKLKAIGTVSGSKTVRWLLNLVNEKIRWHSSCASASLSYSTIINGNTTTVG